jgi:AmmeMemoRadiSam system protein B
LGDIEINEELARDIINLADCAEELSQAHAQEHSLEVQLPFLQTALTDFKIVPILIQRDEPEIVAELSAALARIIKQRSVLLLGTTDLCHYPAYDEAKKSDRVIVNAIEKFDTQLLRDAIRDYMSTHSIRDLHCMMCSTGAVYTTLETAKALGAERIEVLKTANSGDIPGSQRHQVVGYLSAVIIQRQ